MTVAAPDVLRAEIDRREADCNAGGITMSIPDAMLGTGPDEGERTRGYLTALRTILNEHQLESQCCGGKWYPRPTVRAVAAALTRENHP